LIEEVSIRNIGGVASATLRFEKGFTVITGESGAGKSSLVRSLELLGGKRSQTAFLRAGEEEGSVEAVLSGIGGGTAAELADPEEGGALFAKRIIARNGRSRTYFQDRAAPLSVFASVMNERMRIQSQFAQIELLDPKRQMELLDFCGGERAGALKTALSKAFSDAVECERSLRTARAREQELRTRFRDGDSILSAARGLKAAPGCEEAWEARVEKISTDLAIQRKLLDNLLEMTGGAAGRGLLDSLESAGLDILKNLPADGESLSALFNEGLEKLQVFVKGVEARTTGISPGDLEREREVLEKKIGLLRKLKRATGTRTAEEFIDWCVEASKAAEWLREQEKISSALTEKGRSLRKEAARLAAELRAARTETARLLEDEVNRHLAGLAMEDCRFSVRLEELEKIRSTGADEITFTLSSGGRTETPVNKSASGGELSRILLAIQLSLPKEALPPTLIFDEVEAGLGGRAAVLAGYKLLELSRRCQVILVTHEGTIAALADSHFMVSKKGESVEAQKLQYGERVKEIARMLSGDSGLPEAVEHARILLSERRGGS
jgi:DNA repair protein RecN (Recombination protein N)